MKKTFYLLLIGFLGLLSFGANAQWTDTGKAMVTEKNVSIGSSISSHSLYVRKNHAAWQARFTNNYAAGADVYLAHGSGYGMFIKGKTTDNKYTLLMRNGNNVSTNVFYNNGKVGLGLTGYVGIGTTAPTERLHVEGQVLARSYSPQIILRRNTSVGGYIQGISTQLEDGTPNWWFGTLHGTEWRVSKGPYNASPLLRIKEDGEVYFQGKMGIGTTVPQHKLHVNGDFKSDAANVSSLKIAGLSGSSTPQMLTVSANGSIGKASIPSGSSVWNTSASNVSTTVGSYGKVDLNEYGTDVALRLERQNNSSTWWMSHRGPSGASVDENLEFVHYTPSEGYVTPAWMNRDGLHSYQVSSQNFILRNNWNYPNVPGSSPDDSMWDLSSANPSQGDQAILKLKSIKRNKSVLEVLKNGSVDIMAVPASGLGAKMTLDGNGSIILEARNNQNLAIKGANDIVIQNINGSGNIKMTPTDFACINGRLEIKGSGGCAPDYVFADDYKLRTIEELASYIEKESHLPGVKSAEAFANSGFDVVADSYSFLEKIEELALYTIAQEEKIGQLTEQLEKQQAETAELQKMLKQLLNK